MPSTPPKVHGGGVLRVVMPNLTLLYLIRKMTKLEQELPAGAILQCVTFRARRYNDADGAQEETAVELEYDLG